jgi:hypothetical protein
MDFACQRCHETAALTELAKFAEDFHEADKSLADIGINSGLTGTWWDSDRSGEGFLMEFGFSPGGLTLFGSFYTYDSEGNQVWLTVQSTSMVGTTVNVNVFITDGAKWGDDFNTADVNTTLWGLGSFTFPTCTAGSVSLSPTEAMQEAGFTDLAYDLTRDLLESGIQCPTFVNNAP